MSIAIFLGLFLGLIAIGWAISCMLMTKRKKEREAKMRKLLFKDDNESVLAMRAYMDKATRTVKRKLGHGLKYKLRGQENVSHIINRIRSYTNDPWGLGR